VSRRPLARLATLPAVVLLLAGCARTYHPEYHPETRFSFVQNVSYGVPAAPEVCKLGRTGECWRSCFEHSRGESCYLLGVMFETGHGVPRSHDDAIRMTALAAQLGYAPAAIDVEMAAPYLDLWTHDSTRAPEPETRHAERAKGTNGEKGTVSSPGGVVVYGSVNGDIYIGR